MDIRGFIASQKKAWRSRPCLGINKAELLSCLKFPQRDVRITLQIDVTLTVRVPLISFQSQAIYISHRNLLMKRKSTAVEPAQASTNAQPDPCGLTSSSAQNLPTRRRRKVEDTGYGATADFQYQPLEKGQIRLIKYIRETRLRSSQAVTGRFLNFEIHHVSLVDPPAYLALSYAWGDPTPSKIIFCNDKKLMITHNLDRALRAVFYAIQKAGSEIWAQGEDIYLWADGICINQPDTQEKDVQVPQMGAIFSKARGAIGYIGAPETSNASAGLDAVAAWGRMKRCPVTGNYVESDDSEDLSDRMWQDLDEFWSNEWFIRTWVTQEMVLSANVAFVYGTIPEVEIWPFWLLVECCNGNKKAWTAASHEVLLWGKMKQPDYRLNLVDPVIKSLYILINTRSTHASDIRDKIYAVLALFGSEDREAIVVDYSTTNSVQQVYVHVAEHFVRTPYGMIFLEQAGTSRNLPDIPSWVPDWSFKPRNFLPSWLYCCATSRKANVVVHSTAKRLSVSGAIIDSVMTLGSLVRYPESVFGDGFWVAHRKRIFSATKHGLLGVVPDDTRIGDVVAVLFGGWVPFILRPAGDGEFELVGACYIHGIMDGELMDEDNPMRKVVDFKVQDFIIK